MAGTRSETPRDLVPGFARLVKRARKALKWSQRKLSAEAGVSAMCICDLEAQRRSPSLRVASRIARALNLDVKLSDPVPRPVAASR